MELQKSSLCVSQSHEMVRAVIADFESTRDSKFEVIWQKSVNSANDLDLNEPAIPRLSKRPRRYDTDSEAHSFDGPEEYYRRMYYKVYDRVVISLKAKFDSDTMSLMNELEAFAIRNPADTDKIFEFYDDDFRKDRLERDRDFVVNACVRSNVIPTSLQDVVSFLKENASIKKLVPEYTKFIQLLLTIPGSSCTNERSFSSLRRLKTYLRSNIQQDRLNHVAVLHIYPEETENLDLGIIMDEFIKKNSKRSAVFALNFS